MNRTTKKILSYALKAGILAITTIFIYHKLNDKHDLRQFKELVWGMDHSRAIVVMTMVGLLMLVNWFLEVGKWRYITKTLSPMSFWQATEAVFCGLSWAIFTPNRLGEYAGRVMFLPSRKRIHGVFAMAVGSYGQNVVTNVVGATALVFFVSTYMDDNSKVLFLGLSAFVCAFALLMVLCFFKIKWMVSLLNSIKGLKKYHRFFKVMGRYKFAELLRIMGFCVARFATFSLQYYLILHLLIPDLSLPVILMMVYVMFLIQSALPSLDILDIGVRNITAGTLFAYVTDQNIAVMAGITSIWFINLVIPAILGALFVFKLKFFDNDL